jgi:hypothetical protein
LSDLKKLALQHANDCDAPSQPVPWDSDKPSLYAAPLAVLRGDQQPSQFIDIPRATLSRIALDFTGAIQALRPALADTPRVDAFVFEPMSGVRVVLSGAGDLLAVTSTWLFINTSVEELADDDGMIFALQPSQITPALIMPTAGLREEAIGDGNAPIIQRGNGQQIKGAAIRFPAIMLAIWNGPNYYTRISSVQEI